MLHHFLLVILVVVVKDVVCPALGHYVHALFGPGRTNNHRAHRSGDLHSCSAHRPASAVDEHRLPGLGLRPQDQRLVRGEEGDAEGGSLGEGKSRVKREDISAV